MSEEPTVEQAAAELAREADRTPEPATGGDPRPETPLAPPAAEPDPAAASAETELPPAATQPAPAEAEPLEEPLELDLHDAPPPVMVQCPNCQAPFALGPEDFAPYQPNQSPSFKACVECEGLGRVGTGSLIPGLAFVDCPTCKGAGYLRQEGEQWVPGDAEPQQPAPLEPLVAAVPPEPLIDLSRPA